MKIFISISILFLIAASVYAFSIQEKLIFFPEKLPADYQFKFGLPFEELNFNPDKKSSINALLFKAKESKGVILYLHGNAGSLRTWGSVAPAFVENGYDVLIMDYRGFGKSTGKMSEANLFSDAQFVYDSLKQLYPENKIIVYGRSIGTGIATYVASQNNIKMLMLETPYFSLKDLVKNLYPIVPGFILRFPLRTDLMLPKVKCPVYVFHGTQDEVIYYESSLKLQKLFKPEDRLFTIQGGGHNNLEQFAGFRVNLNAVLAR